MAMETLRHKITLYLTLDEYESLEKEKGGLSFNAFIRGKLLLAQRAQEKQSDWGKVVLSKSDSSTVDTQKVLQETRYGKETKYCKQCLTLREVKNGKCIFCKKPL